MTTKSLSRITFDKFPKMFVKKSISKYIYSDDNETINISCYEYYLYQQLEKYLSARSIFIEDSIKYRSLESELIKDWTHNKPKLLKQLKREKLNQSTSDFIRDIVEPLDEKIILVNEAIQSGENADVNIKNEKNGDITWTLPYDKTLSDLNNPFYNELPLVSISRVLRYVDGTTNFMNKFTHIKSYHAKASMDECAIYAALIANGTNMGTLKMSHISDINYSSLASIEKNYLRLETLREANDVISNAISNLAIFQHWNLNSELLHASLDGQKFKAKKETILSRYSQKYFGFDKGVVAYSMIANHVPLITKIIGANDHESRHLFDLVYNNTSEVQPDIFSTDTEGANQLNFLLLYMIDRVFAPRYRSLTNKSESIISFSDPSTFKDQLIKPKKQFNSKLVLSEEENVKHIIASLLVGETSQSNIVTKLSNTDFKSKTKLALWEMNAALLTEYLLDYIGNNALRHSVHGALNRGEAYHQLRRHIAKVNGGAFRGSNEKEITVWNECARLLSNAIIYYNAVMLTRLFQQSESQGNIELGNLIKRLSPVAWTHVNFYGKYEFLSSEESIDIDKMLGKISIQSLLKKTPRKILVAA